MNENKYPIISAEVSFSILNDKMALLTRMDDFKTKLINNFQAEIIKLCDGKRNIEEIIKVLDIEKNEIYTISGVNNFIEKLISMRYLQWSPVKLENINISSLKASYKKTENFFYPTQLHTITISITESCCMKCGHCSQSAPYGKGDEIKLEKIKEILTDGYQLGARYFGVFGGEPMMHPNIYEIVEYAYGLGYRDVLIFSKASLIDIEKAKKLRSIGINRMQISCDSHIPELYDKIVSKKDAFRDFYRGLYSLMNVGIEILLKIVVTNSNIDYMFEMIDYFIENGVYNINLEIVVPVGRADFKIIPESKKIYDLAEGLEKLKEENNQKYEKVSFKYLEYGNAKSCSGGIGSLMIFADGTVGPCDKSYEYRDIISFGNINDNSLAEIWEKGNYRWFRNLNDNQKCKECNNLLSCRGGCPLNALILNKSIGSPDVLCKKISGKETGILFKD